MFSSIFCHSPINMVNIIDGSTMLCIIFIHVQFLFTQIYSLENNDYAELCAQTIKCNAKAKYRSFDGSCNNLITPWLGASKTPHIRLLDPHYSDGVYAFRNQTDGKPLPNPREINLKVFFFKHVSEWNDHNVLFMQWGQFIAHDIAFLPADTSMGKDCCNFQNKERVPVQCRAVINVPADDPIYPDRGQTCINFIRAETSSTYKCPLKPATFMVLSNHFIDGSQIYGTNKKLASSLRSFWNGRLKSEFLSDSSEEFCPQKNRKTFKCETSPKSRLCFAAGDNRVNQNLGIALFHNMFLRFHNVIASKIQKLNPSWSDETLYQEARKIVIAVIQQITYTQYLPILLGKKFLTKNGFFEETVYNESVNPSTSIEFSAGAFRVLHKQIPPVLILRGQNGAEMHRTMFSDWMDKPDLMILPNFFDRLLRGFQDTQTRADQPSYNPLITNYLFLHNEPKSKGQDLMALDIQRGRDTGLPPYNEMRTICGIPEAKTIDNLTDLLDAKDVEDLKKIYSDVNDIDFIVGALLEKPVKGTKVGPMARCIITDSFRRYKFGDRFFYDVQGQPGSFTPAQLETIKSINFGHVICATSNLEYLPKDVFRPFSGRYNSEKIDCKTFNFNLYAWEDHYHNYYDSVKR